MKEKFHAMPKGAVPCLILGMLGCLCYGGGDWLMAYAEPSSGELYWLSEGTAQIASWRNNLAMALAFPGILFYAAALFAMAGYIRGDNRKKIYRAVTAISLTPWMCLHLFYIMILYTFAWMHQNGYADAAQAVCEAVYAHFSWLRSVCMVMMLPPFLYWFYLQIGEHTLFPQKMAFTSVLVIYFLLYLVRMLIPRGAFWLGFTNGLMSESMIIWFAIHLVWTLRHSSGCAANKAWESRR